MQKLGLSQSLQQKLSPQQIQFIKLLQVPTAELENRIEEELELNPVLEEGSDNESEESNESEEEETFPETEEQSPDAEEPTSSSDDVDIKDYLRDDDYNSYKTQSEGDGDDEDDREMPVPMGTSLHET